MLVLAYGQIKIETKVRGGKPWLTEGSLRALSLFLSNAASEGLLRLRGRPQQPFQLGDMQDIPTAYFSKERAFDDGTIGRLPYRSAQAVVSEKKASSKVKGRENNWVEVTVSRDDLCSLLNLARPEVPSGGQKRHIKRGRKPGPYMDELRKFLKLYHCSRGGLGAATLTDLETEARAYLKRQNVKGVPNTRSGLQPQNKEN